MISFKVGQVVSNSDIVSEFKCGNMGGMRRSKQSNVLVLISDRTKGLYEDKWCNNILHYTGMGKKGDQNRRARQNKTLDDSRSNGVDIHLFEVLKPKQYTYYGLVILAGEPYEEYQPDEDGKMRKVWMFPLRVKDDLPLLTVETWEENFKIKEEQARKLDTCKLKEAAEKHETNDVAARKVISKVYERNAFICEWVKRKANGKCQLCKKPAPFETKDGMPYLETHHIVWLSQGGGDTISNTVALCPNCHRKMHILNNMDDVLLLTKN